MALFKMWELVHLKLSNGEELLNSFTQIYTVFYNFALVSAGFSFAFIMLDFYTLEGEKEV